MDAHAKINLFLEVERRRDDGYHDIVSVFQEIDLADRLEAETVGGDSLELTVEGDTVPTDGSNLILRAVDALRNRFGIGKGLRMHVCKRIPVGAGLGGGSSDAAAALRLAVQLWNLPADRNTLVDIASGIGSDVPFFLVGGTCVCRGRGEQIEPRNELPLPNAVLVLPPWSISTLEAYAALAGEKLGTQSAEMFLRAMEQNDFRGIAAAAYNRFEGAATKLEPRQGKLMEALCAHGGLTARMSGSGSTVWCVADEDKDNMELARSLSRVRNDGLFGSAILPVTGVRRSASELKAPSSGSGRG